MFTRREDGSRNRNLLGFLEQSLELISVFSKEPAETLFFFFFLKRQAKNIKTNYACTKSTDLIL
jgi:hypothetical protein